MEPEGLIIKLKSFAHNGEDWVTEILKDIDLINHRIKSGKDVTGKFNSEQFNFPYPAYKNLVSYELKK